MGRADAGTMAAGPGGGCTIGPGTIGAAVTAEAKKICTAEL
jgi:hypothetical protein